MKQTWNSSSYGNWNPAWTFYKQSSKFSLSENVFWSTPEKPEKVVEMLDAYIDKVGIWVRKRKSSH